MVKDDVSNSFPSPEGRFEPGGSVGSPRHMALRDKAATQCNRIGGPILHEPLSVRCGGRCFPRYWLCVSPRRTALPPRCPRSPTAQAVARLNYIRCRTASSTSTDCCPTGADRATSFNERYPAKALATAIAAGGPAGSSPRPLPSPRALFERRPQSFVGSISINSRPQGAVVFLNGRRVGTTPLLMPELPVGSRAVRLTMSGYNTWSQAVQVVADRRTTVSATLVEAPATTVSATSSRRRDSDSSGLFRRTRLFPPRRSVGLQKRNDVVDARRLEGVLEAGHRRRSLPDFLPNRAVAQLRDGLLTEQWTRSLSGAAVTIGATLGEQLSAPRLCLAQGDRGHERAHVVVGSLDGRDRRIGFSVPLRLHPWRGDEWRYRHDDRGTPQRLSSSSSPCAHRQSTSAPVSAPRS